jgi:hypothetical protein
MTVGGYEFGHVAILVLGKEEEGRRRYFSID